MPDFQRELQLLQLGHAHIAGTDEAGRGPLAGPVVAGAAVLSEEFAREVEDRLDDSKKLSSSVRDELSEQIRERAAWGIGVVSAREIDELNIRVASWEAMRRAIEDLERRFPDHAPDFVLVDGLGCREIAWKWPYEALVKGDARSLSIAAASVLAKTHRDALMVALDAQFPDYGFAGHKGYPTPSHRAALIEHGPCDEHRRSFAPVRACLPSK